jgi:hypothetical protein
MILGEKKIICKLDIYATCGTPKTSSLVAWAPLGTIIIISLALPLVDANVIVEQRSIRGHLFFKVHKTI